MITYVSIKRPGKVICIYKMLGENMVYDDRKVDKLIEENERRFRYHLVRTGIHDLYKDFYRVGIYTHWKAYNQYRPNEGTLATYFNYTIRKQLREIHKNDS